jgi:hypothetical protein
MMDMLTVEVLQQIAWAFNRMATTLESIEALIRDQIRQDNEERAARRADVVDMEDFMPPPRT